MWWREGTLTGDTEGVCEPAPTHLGVDGNVEALQGGLEIVGFVE